VAVGVAVALLGELFGTGQDSDGTVALAIKG